MDKSPQKELEQPAKYYQLLDVKKDINNLEKTVATSVEQLTAALKEISQNTRGVVTFKQMEEYVDKRIEEKSKPLWEWKSEQNKLKWLILGLIVTDIATRILK